MAITPTPRNLVRWKEEIWLGLANKTQCTLADREAMHRLLSKQDMAHRAGVVLFTMARRARVVPFSRDIPIGSCIGW